MHNYQNTNNSGVINTINNIQVNGGKDDNSDNKPKKTWQISVPLAIIADLITIFLFANATISHIEKMRFVPTLNFGSTQQETAAPLLSILWPLIIMGGLAIGLVGFVILFKMIFGATNITPRLLGKYQKGKIAIYLLDRAQKVN